MMLMHATSLGIYWTHVGPGGWYPDSVPLHSRLDGGPHSNRGVGIDLEGHGTNALLEGGYPIWLTEKISLDPQVQIIWQHVSFDRVQDRFSSVSFDADDAWTGQIGARLQGTFVDGSTT
jgi:outer membrane autotransporter protein